MISLQNNVSNRISLSLNQYIYHSINIFKYDLREIEEHIKQSCIDNPLMFIDESKIPLADTNLHNHETKDIINQLSTYFKCTLNESDFCIMKFLLHSLNSKGFLETSIEDIEKHTHVTKVHILKLIKLLKSYDNRGIGSLNTIDYLKFQLVNADQYNEEYFRLFSNHLKEICHHDFNFLNKIQGVTQEQFMAYIDTIKNDCSLSPLPGDEPLVIYPDASIILSEGVMQIQINDHLVDNLKFEPITVQSSDKAFNQVIDQYKQQYEELLSLLTARKTYLSQILSIIIDIQHDYLTQKVNYLNALDQSFLAEKTGLSHATISRLICNKYVHTPRGLMPLKSLLSKKCSKSWSVSYVKHLIESIDGFKTLSDRSISQKLSEHGVAISRRTVNKYKHQILEH
jgi:RNA polymerase sigma-54 factor